MNVLLMMIITLLLFGGAGLYFGGPAIGVGGAGLVLVITFMGYMMGAFR